MKFFPLLVVGLCALSGCEQRRTAPDERGRAEPARQPGAVTPATADNPFAKAAPAPAAHSRFTGRVIQRLDAGSYVYLEVEKPGSGPTWIVTAEALAPDADRVAVHVVKRVEHFESRRLQRSFSPLGFAIVRKDD
ncbi:MAG TPA: hypothetical protein VI072_35980 [Polyangiaceae bacterium]